MRATYLFRDKETLRMFNITTSLLVLSAAMTTRRSHRRSSIPAENDSRTESFAQDLLGRGRVTRTYEVLHENRDKKVAPTDEHRSTMPRPGSSKGTLPEAKKASSPLAAVCTLQHDTWPKSFPVRRGHEDELDSAHLHNAPPLRSLSR
ncbi:uncharacterized protein E0L32_004366 [Thyridium curvatum]|uniref:Uncharacterized protein n=1 Tax=Thyridium curvatum TaxID=1093900 RepID=A0A507B8C5_9PEZI|nr:uncharacterized protein E0L32_004366 [Thyridium curvatum]TPX15386.1 hypothetical protein E0L32_004366 [Thyridium curvatum]